MDCPPSFHESGRVGCQISQEGESYRKAQSHTSRHSRKSPHPGHGDYTQSDRGGSFVTFAHDPGVDVSQIEAKLRKHLKEVRVKQMLEPFQDGRAFLVQGEPWVEDLHRFPTSRLKVEFRPTAPEEEAAELSQERLFSLFRKCGRLINVVSRPPEVKISPKYAYMDFRVTRHAVMRRTVWMV